eukprot:scaffold37789_cov283-Skeletonema_dohrnii-CCMP3373.AAC.1
MHRSVIVAVINSNRSVMNLCKYHLSPYKSFMNLCTHHIFPQYLPQKDGNNIVPNRLIVDNSKHMK